VSILPFHLSYNSHFIFLYRYCRQNKSMKCWISFVRWQSLWFSCPDIAHHSAIITGRFVEMHLWIWATLASLLRVVFLVGFLFCCMRTECLLIWGWFQQCYKKAASLVVLEYPSTIQILNFLRLRLILIPLHVSKSYKWLAQYSLKNKTPFFRPYIWHSDSWTKHSAILKIVVNFSQPVP
jgi:hypothetical protein